MKLEIITHPKYLGNAYVIETIDGLAECLWCAPRFKDGTVDDHNWCIVEDEYVFENVTGWNEVEVIDRIDLQDFLHRVNFHNGEL
jgi:hypothetical protein